MKMIRGKRYLPVSYIVLHIRYVTRLSSKNTNSNPAFRITVGLSGTLLTVSLYQAGDGLRSTFSGIRYRIPLLNPF